MKVKLLKKLRKRFEIYQEQDYFYVVDNNSLHWDDTFPYKYMPSETIEQARNERRELILKHIPNKIKKVT